MKLKVKSCTFEKLQLKFEVHFYKLNSNKLKIFFDFVQTFFKTNSIMVSSELLFF